MATWDDFRKGLGSPVLSGLRDPDGDGIAAQFFDSIEEADASAEKLQLCNASGMNGRL